jgi:hypothetical protein
MKHCALLFLATVLSAGAGEPALKVAVYDNEFVGVRVSQLPEDFAQQFRAVQPTNHLAGVILDLRFTLATGAVFAPFVPAQKMPVVVLVNSQTQPAVWAWAASLRAAGAGILIGSPNPAVPIAPDITVATRLEDEQKFQQNPFAEIAANQVAYLSNTNSLLPFIDHTSEAELVRQRVKDGEEDGTSTPRADAPKVIRDPALARAVDWLKALAILKPVHG